MVVYILLIEPEPIMENAADCELGQQDDGVVRIISVAMEPVS